VGMDKKYLSKIILNSAKPSAIFGNKSLAVSPAIKFCPASENLESEKPEMGF